MTALYFLFTLLLETPVHLALLRGRPLAHVMLACLLVNGITHPLASYLSLEWDWNFWLLEALVFAVEGVLIFITWRISALKSALLSFAANGVSAGASLLCMAFFA
jgi:hypothetical protein